MRLFVAVWPPPPVIEQLARMARPAVSGLRWTTEDQWHVTLRFLGEVGDDGLDGGKMALRKLEPGGRLSPVTAIAGPAVIRLGSSVLCLPVAGLDALAASVGRLTAGIGAPVGHRPFRGHLTLARINGSARVTAEPLSASWAVEEVTLVASRLHREGARYEVISRARLAG